MTGPDFSALADLKKGVKTKSQWRPLEITDLGYGTVLAFDQSLAATGVVLVEHTPEGFAVILSETLKPQESDPYSTGRDLGRGELLARRAMDLIGNATTLGFNIEVMHESPPNPAAVKGNPMSSWLSAQALWIAAGAHDIPINMVGAQPGKKLICGNYKAEKKDAHAELKKCFTWMEHSNLVTNEAERDALLVALVHLSRKDNR